MFFNCSEHTAEAHGGLTRQGDVGPHLATLLVLKDDAWRVITQQKTLQLHDPVPCATRKINIKKTIELKRSVQHGKRLYGAGKQPCKERARGLGSSVFYIVPINRVLT